MKVKFFASQSGIQGEKDPNYNLFGNLYIAFVYKNIVAYKPNVYFHTAWGRENELQHAHDVKLPPIDQQQDSIKLIFEELVDYIEKN